MRTLWIVVVVAAALAIGCSRQEAGWRDARRADSIAAYEAYLAQYPAGAHAGGARSRILELREAQDWARANRLRTPEAWQRYLSEWPEGRHAAEARELLAAFVPGAAGAEGAWSVQLGAYAGESAARAALAVLARERAEELSGTKLVIRAPSDSATDVWRLRTMPLPEAAARDLCARFRARGVDCVPVVE
ncbi:MAG: SPOR domain-containing protein [Gammaproteobacteria bacterium]